jgi:hypothetical protein
LHDHSSLSVIDKLIGFEDFALVESSHTLDVDLSCLQHKREEWAQELTSTAS